MKFDGFEALKWVEVNENRFQEKDAGGYSVRPENEQQLDFRKNLDCGTQSGFLVQYCSGKILVRITIRCRSEQTRAHF